MKENIIRKINITGHIAQIIALIFKILVILCLLCTAGLTIISFGLPANALDVTVTHNADANVDFKFTGKQLSASDQNALQKGSADLFEVLFDNDGPNLSSIVKTAGGTVKYKNVTENSADTYISKIAPMRVTMQDIRYMLILADVELILLLICIFIASSLSKELRFCDSPFERDVIRKLRMFAFSLLPWALVGSFGATIVSRINGGSGIVFDLNLGVLIIVLMLLTLTRIFKYGAILQQESDETL